TQMEVSDVEDSEGSGSEASDDEAAGEGVDEELRRKIQEALGGGGDTAAAASESSDEEDFDDEQMQVFDDKLNEIFAHKKANKRAARELKVSFVNFKLRVLDLAETFLQRQAGSPLVLRLLPALLELVRSTHRDSRYKPIHDRAMAIVGSKRSAVPRDFDVAEAQALQTLVHERARRAADRPALRMFGSVAGMLARMLAERGLADSVHMAYSQSLDDFMTRKASQLFSDFFTSAAARLAPAYLLPLWRVAADAMHKYAKPGCAVNVFRQVQAFVLASGVAAEVVRVQTEQDSKPLVKVTEALLGDMQAAVVATVRGAVETPPKVDAQRLREVLQACVQLVTRCAKSLLAPAARKALRNSEEWTAAFAALAAAPPPMGAPAMQHLCRSLADVERLCARAAEKKAEKEKKISNGDSVKKQK
ncbi:DNA-directed DNA polymerase, partial [Coemansia sp. RSA 2607]